MVDIKPEHYSIIRKILLKHNLKNKVFIFGSRAKDCAKPFSDLDLAVDCDGKKIDFPFLAKISADFENSILPYSVDVIDLNSIDEEFKKYIKNDLVKLEF